MAESGTTEKAEPAPKKSGFFKALLGTLAGVLSGAFMMYLSPLLDKVVKPARPVANFAVDLQGRTVQFHNRSASRADGWWDFGDGAPLEPVVHGQDTVTHTYAKPGTYTVKLSLRNLLNEESDRTVTINIDGQNNEPPAIVSLDVIPVSPGSYAPATFRLISRTKNASLCVWDTDEDRPLEIVTDPTEEQDRLVTFSQPGGYMVKLAAVNGKQAKEKSVIVQVLEPPSGAVTAVMHVTEAMTRTTTAERAVTVTETFTAAQGGIQAISRQIPANQGHEISAVRIDNPNVGGVRNLQAKVAADKKSVLLTGELLKDNGLLQRSKPMAPVAIKLALTECRNSPVHRPTTPVTTMLAVPGASVLNLPAAPCDCSGLQRQFRLELREGDRVIWQDSRLPKDAPVVLQGRRCSLTATVVGDQVRIEVTEPRAGRIAAN